MNASSSRPLLTDAPRTRDLMVLALRLYILVAAPGLAVLTFLVLSVPYFPIDLALERAVQSLRSPWLDSLTAMFTSLGFFPLMDIMVLLIVFGLLIMRYWIESVMTLVAAGGASLVFWVIAPLVHRARPSTDLVRVTDVIGVGGFPSGHVLTITAFVGFLIYLTFVLTPSTWGRTLVSLGGLLTISGMGFSRVYVGGHWPSDVLAGYLFGTLWLASCVWIYRTWLRRRWEREVMWSTVWARAAQGATREPVLVIARVGYAARGALYLLLSASAMLTAVGATPQVSDRLAALQGFDKLPLAGLLLLVISLGLVDYSMWSLIRSLFDPEHRQGMTGVVHRIGNAVSAAAYLALASTVATIAIGNGEQLQSSEQLIRQLTVETVHVPGGGLLITLAGGLFLAMAIAQAYAAVTAEFVNHMDAHVLGPQGREYLRWIGRVGIAARGFVFAVIGSLLIAAALRGTLSSGIGMGGALETITGLPAGNELLIAMAAGLFSFGLFSVVQARCHRLRPD